LAEEDYRVMDASRNGERASEGAAEAGGGPGAAERSPRGDRSVRSRAEDTLGRVAFADALARQVAGADPAEEVVFGLVGPYGSGKTSLLNMLAEALEEDHEGVVVLRFTPWLFTGTEHLVGVLFEELGAQLLESPDDRLKRVGEALEAYGGVLGVLRVVPGVGYWAGLAEKSAGLLGRFLSQRGAERPPSLLGQRRELERALSELDEKVVVLLDEVDRLRRQEIRDVVGLVRLNADLPNLVFVLAYERRWVEEALQEAEGDGRAYLEKIVQVVQDVPKAQDVDLSKELLDAINAAVDGAPETGPLDEHRFWNLFHAVIRPLVGSVRDVRRYANGLPVTFDVLGDEVALEDVLALETIRMLLPDAFAALVGSADALTTPHDQLGVTHHSSDPRTKETKAKVEAFVRSGGAREDVTREARERLFPASLWMDNNHYGSDWQKSWSKGRLVAHPRVLNFYLEKRLPEGVLPAREVEGLFEALADGERLRRLLEAMDPDTLEHALERLEDFEDDYRPADAEKAVPVLLNQMPRLRQGSRGFMDLGANMKLTRVVLRLLRKVENPAAVAMLVKTVSPRIEALSSRAALVEMVGHRENISHRLVTEEEGSLLEEQLLTAMEHTPTHELARERDLVRLLYVARRIDPVRGGDLVRRLAESDEVFLAVVRSLRREVHSVTAGDLVSRAEEEFAWSTLCDLFGEETARRRVHQLMRVAESGTSDAGPDDKTLSALRLAEDYAVGRRRDE
jgi:energy-coupling factor transporter ATP-binding protein EcfA2